MFLTRSIQTGTHNELRKPILKRKHRDGQGNTRGNPVLERTSDPVAHQLAYTADSGNAGSASIKGYRHQPGRCIRRERQTVLEKVALKPVTHITQRMGTPRCGVTGQGFKVWINALTPSPRQHVQHNQGPPEQTAPTSVAEPMPWHVPTHPQWWWSADLSANRP